MIIVSVDKGKTIQIDFVLNEDYFDYHSNGVVVRESQSQDLSFHWR
jgi:hypothetical protein